MATEILVNDGGAPARILPYTAGSTISAGYPVTVATDGEVDQMATSGSLVLGFSLTAATTGNICNVISGHGVLLNVAASGAGIVIGTNLGTSTQDGALCAMPSTADGNANTAAISLGTGSASVGLLKVQVV